MTICRYFLQNRCAFGNRCKFEHVYPSDVNQTYRRQVFQSDSGRRGNPNIRVNDYNDYNQDNYRGGYRQNDKYHYNRNNHAQNQVVHQVDRIHVQQFGELSPIDISSLIKSEIDQMEAGKMWNLTSFGPLRHYGSVPRWYDYSPEEVRWAAYVAKQQNSYDQYKASLELLYHHAKVERDKLNVVTKESIQMVEQYMRQSGDTIYPLEFDVFRSGIFPDNSFTSSSSGPVATVETEMEESPTSVSPAPNNNLFGSVPLQPNIFGSVPPPQANLFGSVPLPPQANIFGAVPQQCQTSFGFNQPLGTNIFGATPSSQTSPFGSVNPPTSGDCQTKLEFMDEDLDYRILTAIWKGDDYSDPSTLTEEEMAQFKAQKFVHGKVPLVPPPRQFC